MPGAPMDVAFYAVSSSKYFLGLTGLVNSLRLTGHTAPIVVLDVGLTDAQRAALAGQCEFVPAPAVAVTTPALLKAAAPLARPAEVIVLLDCDTVVTGSLQEIIEQARNGHICVYPDTDDTRWFAEWETAFGLPPMRRQPYMNSGFLALSTRAWPQFLERWWDLCHGIRDHQTIFDWAPDGPTAQGDQDAFNALMMSEFPVDAVLPLPALEAPMTQEDIRAEVEIVDERSLTCVRQGAPVRLVQWCYWPKPWFSEARAHNQVHPYARLLIRATTWPDAPARLPLADIPWWMRQDPFSQARAVLRRFVGRSFRSLQRLTRSTLPSRAPMQSPQEG